MTGRESLGKRAQHSMTRLVVALFIALALFVCIVALGAHSAPKPVVADETTGPAGPICFYQHAYPVCIERPGRNVLNAPDAVSPKALLDALVDGPTPDESAQGIESALPADTQLVSVQTDGVAITVRLAFPAGYLDAGLTSRSAEGAQYTFSAPSCEAIENQIARTLLPLNFGDLYIEAQDPSAPERFLPLSDFLPAITLPQKEAQDATQDPAVSGATSPPHGQPPVATQGRPQGSLSGKTVYVSAGHGWQWNGYKWLTQRPPYPDATTGYEGPIIEDHNNGEVVNQYLLRYLWNAGADVWPVRERGMTSFEQIVDDGDSGFNTGGTWRIVNNDGYLSRHLTTTTGLLATASVTWTVGPVPTDDNYALYVWYIPGSDRATDAHYTVHHAGGATEFTVSQLHHGRTWRYIGSFPVRAGERLTVSLNNQSATPGKVIVADAIRLGGGWFDDSDLASNGGPVQTEATFAPDEPWWEIAAYYNVQRQGLGLDDLPSYVGDVIARPLWARWEHANTGDDAIYVSWHTNGYNGHNYTTWGTISYIHNTQPVPGSAELRRAIHTELINDFRAGWDSDWRDLGQASRDLGELRELWDEDENNAIPGVLLEIAYHDHITDTDALKDPRFALISARAVYQGIVAYYGTDLPLLPEPPTHLIVRNSDLGQVTVSWRPSPTDSTGLVGDAAESYRIYTSGDGFGWDNGREVTGTHTTISGLQENELVFVRVTAVNAGGESFPTPVLAARSSPSGEGQILLVDGFDRIDRHGLILEDDPTEGINARLFPDQINSFDYVIEHGKAISLPFDSALNEAVAAGDLSLMLYSIVDWILGEESSEDHTLDEAEQAALVAYLESEGALFLSGAEVGWDLAEHGSGLDFFHDYLGADIVDDDAGTYQVTPTSGGIFAGLGTIEFRDNYDVDYPDSLAPRTGSVAALEYLGGKGGTAAIQYDAGGCRRVVYAGFPFETIAATKRSEVMDRVLGFLGANSCLVIAPRTVITSPLFGGASNTVPDFGGTAVGVNPIQRVEVQISDPDERYWDGWRWITASRWLTAVGTAAWHYPLPPTVLTGTTLITTLAQGEHRLWARAWDTATLSDNTPAFVSFVYDTISPTAPALISPSDGVTLSTARTAFSWRAPLSDTGSALAYNLQINDQSITQTMTSYTPTGWLATGVYTWRVRAFDAAGNRSPWTPTRNFSVETFAAYVPRVLKHYSSAEPPACTDLVANGSFETQDSWTINSTPVPAAYTTEQFHSGTRSMRLGIVPSSPGTGSDSYSSVDQTIPVPDGISATLSLWLYPFNENDDTGDLQYIGVRDEEGTWTFLMSDRLDTQSWITLEFDLTPFVGQVINLRLGVKNDGDNDTTALYIDDVRLDLCSQ